MRRTSPEMFLPVSIIADCHEKINVFQKKSEHLRHGNVQMQLISFFAPAFFPKKAGRSPEDSVLWSAQCLRSRDASQCGCAAKVGDDEIPCTMPFSGGEFQKQHSMLFFGRGGTFGKKVPPSPPFPALSYPPLRRIRRQLAAGGGVTVRTTATCLTIPRNYAIIPIEKKNHSQKKRGTPHDNE